MSLPACQQRVLDTIENALQKREPRLASMYAMFTRLTHGEGLPRTERLDAVSWWVRHRRWQLRHSGSSPRSRGPKRQPAPAMRIWLIIPVLIALVVSVVFISLDSSQAACLPASGVHGLMAGQSHSTSCGSGSQYFGHGP
jgi:hypothetical protein